MSIGDTERATQDRVVSFFKDRDILDYEYVGNLRDAANKNIREDRLRAYLRLSGYSQKLIDGAVSELVKAADDMTHGLYDANHKVYSLLKYGAKVKPMEHQRRFISWMWKHLQITTLRLPRKLQWLVVRKRDQTL